MEGSVNLKPNTANRSGLITEAYRVLRPDALIRVHGLAGDRPCPRESLSLPGPAAQVQYVPACMEVAEELAGVGFVDVQFEKFNIDGLPMRELRVAARKPGHRPEFATHYAVYLGPLRQVTDDFGNVLNRGELTALNVHDCAEEYRLRFQRVTVAFRPELTGSRDVTGSIPSAPPIDALLLPCFEQSIRLRPQ